MLDADGALILAGAARRALPEHFLRVELTELFARVAGEHRRLRLQDEGLRVERLARAPGRTVLLAPPALDAGQRIEYRLAPEILHGLQPDLLFVKIEVRYRAQLERLQE